MVLEIGLQLIGNSLTDKVEKSMVSRWMQEYAAYNERRARRQKVLAAIGEGYDTLSEIVAQTEIPQTTCRRIIIELISKNRVQSAKTKNVNDRIELRFELAD